MTEDTPERFCGRCREWWPADTEFFFRRHKDSDSLSAWCKACSREHNRRYDGRKRAVKAA